jgi:hypothetical protein
VTCSAECRRRPGDAVRLFGTSGPKEGAVWRVPLSADEGPAIHLGCSGRVALRREQCDVFR